MLFWKIFSTIALSLGVVLAIATICIKAREKKHTDNRFNVIALWSCATLVASVIHLVLSSSSPWELLFEAFGVHVDRPSISEKILAVLLVVFYIQKIQRWSIAWSGLQTKRSFENRQQGHRPSILIDGLEETWRIVKRVPAPAPYYEQLAITDRLQVSKPMQDLSYQEQVRSLALAIWKEFLIDEKDWIGEAQAWKAIDKTIEQTVLIVCCIDPTVVSYRRIDEQLKYEKSNNRSARIVAVLAQPEAKDIIGNRLREIGDRVEVFSFDEFIARALPLARYRHQIEQDFAVKKLPNSDFSLDSVFAPISVNYRRHHQGHAEGARLQNASFDEYARDWLATTDMRQVALLGEYGQGKSTAALHLTYRLLHDPNYFEACGRRIPILVRLTGQSPKTSSAEELLDAWGGRYGLNGRALLALHRAGKVVVIFDAFDEMANVTSHSDRIDHFNALWQFSCPSGKVLFTGRPNFFLDDEEQKSILRIADSNAAGAYCSAIRIAAFELEQIRTSLRWLPERRVEEFMRAVEEQPALFEIVRRPSLLFQVAQLWDLGQLSLKKGEVNSAGVILQFVRYSLDRQFEKQANDVAKITYGGPFIGLRRSELEYFMQGCAVAALTSGRNNSLPAPAFRQTIIQLLDQLPETLLSSEAQNFGSFSLPLVERVRDPGDRIDVCSNAVRTHGVLELDPTKGDHYKFSHKSFAEALAADVVLAAAVQRTGFQRLIWQILRPGREALAQNVIFSFVRDLAAGIGGEVRYSSISAFRNLLGVRSQFLVTGLLAMQTVMIEIGALTARMSAAMSGIFFRGAGRAYRVEKARDLQRQKLQTATANLFGYDPIVNIDFYLARPGPPRGILFAGIVGLSGVAASFVAALGAEKLPAWFSAYIVPFAKIISHPGFLFALAVYMFWSLILQIFRLRGASFTNLAFVYAHMIASASRFKEVPRRTPGAIMLPPSGRQIDQLIFYVLANT